MKDQAKNYFKSLQDQITNSLTEINQQMYKEDTWERAGGGGGVTRIFEGGNLLEKGGVNFSEVYGEFSKEFAKTLPHGNGVQFYATGVSLVLHPTNPFVPTVHANFRYIERGDTGWFGGGADLTPYYLFEEDAKHFHQTYKNTLESFGSDIYPMFKKKCDEYFYLPHRKEARGVGGIFFDYQIENIESKFEMVKACGDSFLESYLPIAKKRMGHEFTEDQKAFQEWRRGRYVEFNLLYDRGTIFGLKTNGRVESILMSFPKHVRWLYDFMPKAGTPEAELQKCLESPRDWV